MDPQAFLHYVEGRPASSIPGSFWFHNTEDQWEGEAAKEAHLTMLRETGVDFLKIMDEIRFAFPTVRTAADWDHYLPPKRKCAQYARQFDVISRIVDALHGETYAYTTIFSPLRCVGMPMGYAFIEAHMAENPRGVQAAFSAMADSLSEYAIDCMAAGADAVYFSSKGAERGRFAEETFVNLILENDRKLFAAICEAAPSSILHLCGFDMELRHYFDFPGAVVNWDVHNNDLSLSEGAKRFRHPVILGGMDDRSGELVDGTDEEIGACVRAIVRDFEAAQTGKRLILGADCTLPTDVAFHRIRVAMDALHAL